MSRLWRSSRSSAQRRRQDLHHRHDPWPVPAQPRSGVGVRHAPALPRRGDAYADRIILIRAGEVVADGTAAEVKALAAGRTVRATLPGADKAALRAIPCADSVEVRRDTVLIHASNSDAVARYLLTSTTAKDLEITTRGLEDAFIALTSDDVGNPNENANDSLGVAR